MTTHGGPNKTNVMHRDAYRYAVRLEVVRRRHVRWSRGVASGLSGLIGDPRLEWQCEAERGAVGAVRHGPQLTAVRLDDRSTDGQAHAQAVHFVVKKAPFGGDDVAWIATCNRGGTCRNES